MSISGQGRKRVTLAQVAERAGVSVSTASSILNGRSSELRIAEETRLRVTGVANDLDYTPNLLVKSLKSGRTNVISFFNAFRTRTRGDLFMDRLAALIEVAAGDAGYDVLVHTNFARSPEETYQFLNGGTADAVILFAPFADDPLLALLRGSRLPTVLIFSSDPSGTIPSVSDDPESGLGTVAKRLVELGHHRVLPLIEIGPSVRDAEIRIKTLRSALESLGVELLEPTAVEPDSKQLAEDLPAILADANQPTAIFCWRDFLAYRVLEACNELNWEIPKRFSVIGYDGIHWPASTPHEATSVVADIEELALQTFRLIGELVNGSTPEQKVLRVKTDLLLGSTLGPATIFEPPLSTLINLEQQ